MGHIADHIRRSIDAINRGDTAAYSSGYTPDALVYDPSYAEPLQGRAAIEQDIAALLRACPDAHATIATLVEEGDQAAVEVTITGTQQGPWISRGGELPPSGRSLAIRTCDIVRVNHDGRYVETIATTTSPASSTNSPAALRLRRLQQPRIPRPQRLSSPPRGGSDDRG